MDDADAILASQGRSRETTIERDALGRWSHDGQPVRHRRVARAFDRWLSRADDGRPCLKNSVNWAYVRIEGPFFFVRSLREDAGGITLVLSDESETALDPQSLWREGDDAVYCAVKEAGLQARFDRFAMQGLARWLTMEGDQVWLCLGGVRYPVPQRGAQASDDEGFESQR